MTTTQRNKPAAVKAPHVGVTSVWISRETHAELKRHAARRGQKLIWLADQLIRRGLNTPN